MIFLGALLKYDSMCNSAIFSNIPCRSQYLLAALAILDFAST